jgi:ribosomal protein S8E
VKWRALRLDTGNYSWGSEAVTRKTRILDVVYNASNNELVRTQTLVKSAIVQVDAAPFKQWYLQHYGVDIGRKKKTSAATKKEGEVRRYVFIVCCFTVFHYKYSVYFLPFNIICWILFVDGGGAPFAMVGVRYCVVVEVMVIAIWCYVLLYVSIVFFGE